MGKYYNAEDLRQQLNVKNIRTIYRYIKHNQVNAVKIGNKYLIEEEEYNRFLREGTQKNYLNNQ